MTVQAAVLRALRKPRGTAEQGFGRTSRRDAWAVYPVLQATVFTICASYLTFSGIFWEPLFHTGYRINGYLSPLFSPLIVWPGMPSWLSPGLLILWIPIGFRATCYYYRKAYYRFYFADPPGCVTPASPAGASNAGMRSSHRKVSGMNARYSRYRWRFWRMNGKAFSRANRRWIVGSPTAQPGGSAK